MKKVITLLCVVLSCAAAVSATDIDDKCVAAYDAVIAGDLSNAEDMANKLYAARSAGTAENLADLAIVYHRLTEKSDDAVSRYDFVLKSIECYKAAAAKDAAAASARFKAKGVAMDAVVKNYEANLGKFRQAITDSVDF